MRTPAAALAALALLVAGAAHAAPPPPGSKYVAMGSSFAAGPGVSMREPGTPVRCGRSIDNYAHQLARRLKLQLTDVSCGGATTANLLAPWGELPAQLDAVDADTRLVTVTIGGNDLGYIARLMNAACTERSAQQQAGSASRCPQLPPSTEAELAGLEARLGEVAAEVHRRAPKARLVFVEYQTILPPSGGCAATPIGPAEAQAARKLAARLAEITERVARAGHAEVLPWARLSAAHHACAAEPWVNGFPGGGVEVKGASYHPNLAGMTAVADALERLLK